MFFGHGILTLQRLIVWRAWLTVLWLPAGATALTLGREATYVKIALAQVAQYQFLVLNVVLWR